MYATISEEPNGERSQCVAGCGSPRVTVLDDVLSAKTATLPTSIVEQLAANLSRAGHLLRTIFSDG
ncbi:MAG: hypothetical protein FJ276_18235 [Planctomycetes bacterium]|nr:hypothetical protein [Planctomycetota bacterium]